MTSPTFRRSLRIISALALVVLLGLTAFLWPEIQQMRAIAALEAAMVMPKANASFGFGAIRSGAPASSMPPWLDSSLEKAVNWFVPPAQANVRRRYLEKFRVPFRDPVDLVMLWGDLSGDPGAVLPRFPHLRKVQIHAESGTEADLARLCQGLRACPQLEEIHFTHGGLTDVPAAQLAGHPNVREMSVYIGDLSPSCVDLFVSLPKLEKLCLITLGAPNHYPSADEKLVRAVEAALPQLKLQWTLVAP